MKMFEKSRMIFVQGETGEEFAANYNKAMDELVEREIKVEERQISIDKMSAVILYNEKVHVAESLEDRYKLAGIIPVHRDCPHYEPVTAYEGECKYANTSRGLLQADTCICSIRWRELEAIDKAKEERGANEYKALSKH